MPARAAQAFLQHRAGHARVGAGQQAGRMELHHLHVAQRQAGAAAPWRGRPCSCRPTACGSGTWSARRRSPAARPWPARSGTGPVRMSIISTPASDCAVLGRDQRHGAMLLQPPDRPRPHLLHQPVDDLDAGEVALVHRAVEGLAGEGLAVQRAVGVAVEEAADLVLQLAHALDGLGHQRPGEVLVGQPLAALDGVHEMALDGVAGVERDVVAALHHARAAALAEQALGRDGDAQVGIGLVRMQRREQPRPAGAEDQDVGLQPFEHGDLALRSRGPGTRGRATGAATSAPDRQVLLALAPRQVLDQQHAHAAQHVHRQQEHEHRLADLEQRIVRPSSVPSSRASPSMASPSARKCSGRKQASASPEMRCTIAAIHSALRRWPVGVQAAAALTAPPPRPRAGPSAASTRPKPHISASSAPLPLSGVHSDSDGPHADGPVHRRRQHEQAVEQPPADAAPRAARESRPRSAPGSSRRR